MLDKIIIFSLLEDLFEPDEQKEIWDFLEQNQEVFLKEGLLNFLPQIQERDRTSASIFPNRKAKAVIYAKQEGVFSGCDLIQKIFKILDPKTTIEILVKDGEKLKNNQQIARIQTSLFCLLLAERTVLNFLCHLSGVATKTAEFVDLLKHTQTQLLDSRKTLPGLRNLQKQSVKHGGGQNHRLGLYDQILLKNNHIDAVGSVGLAIQKVLQKWDQKYPILVETRNVKEVLEALEFKHNIDRIMLDNMSLEETSEALKIIKKQIKTEYTGNVNLQNLKQIAQTGVDFVSVGGSLTMQTYRLDLSMKIE